MKRYKGLLFIACIAFIILVGFDTQQNLLFDNIKVAVKDNILRYEVVLKTKDGSPVRSSYDYQGHQIRGFELAVKPHEPLVKLMKLDHNTKYTKMLPHSGGTSSGSQNELLLFVEYIIKDDSNPEEVEKIATKESTMFIFDGANLIKELPLTRQ